ncbi:MAG: hypothetical protein U1C04_06800 [Hydrogenophaga sp.]|nr:hypothetical protein [Hydrogenophaga sp.]
MKAETYEPHQQTLNRHLNRVAACRGDVGSGETHTARQLFGSRRHPLAKVAVNEKSSSTSDEGHSTCRLYQRSPPVFFEAVSESQSGNLPDAVTQIGCVDDLANWWSRWW